jgi:ABC-type transport system involved in cytochrome bd biosynthesis fused ATPase/permease subunit
MSADRAVLVIAHDEAALRHADAVMVLDGGRISAGGRAGVPGCAMAGLVPEVQA